MFKNFSSLLVAVGLVFSIQLPAYNEQKVAQLANQALVKITSKTTCELSHKNVLLLEKLSKKQTQDINQIELHELAGALLKINKSRYSSYRKLSFALVDDTIHRLIDLHHQTKHRAFTITKDREHLASDLHLLITNFNAFLGMHGHRIKLSNTPLK